MAWWQVVTEWFGMGWSQKRACGTGAVCILKSSLWLQGRSETAEGLEQPHKKLSYEGQPSGDIGP